VAEGSAEGSVGGRAGAGAAGAGVGAGGLTACLSEAGGVRELGSEVVVDGADGLVVESVLAKMAAKMINSTAKTAVMIKPPLFRSDSRES
jgi:hypothetical protein